MLGTEWIDNAATRCFIGVAVYNYFYACGEALLVCLALVQWCDGACWWRALTGGAVVGYEIPFQKFDPILLFHQASPVLCSS